MVMEDIWQLMKNFAENEGSRLRRLAPEEPVVIFEDEPKKKAAPKKAPAKKKTSATKSKSKAKAKA
jgi:hypothetical protein